MDVPKTHNTILKRVPNQDSTHSFDVQQKMGCFHKMDPYLPGMTGVTTPISRVYSPQLPIYEAIYEGYNL